MKCHCGTPCFYYTKYAVVEDVCYKYQINKCPGMSSESKKRKQCDFLDVVELSNFNITKKDEPMILDDMSAELENPVDEIIKHLNFIRTAQDNFLPYDMNVNKILYYSKILNIPPFLPDKITPERYMSKLEKLIENARPHSQPVVFQSINLYPEFSDILGVYKVNSKPVFSTKKKKYTTAPVINESSFLTGGLDPDQIGEQEDELDFEPDVEDDYEDDYDDNENEDFSLD